MRSHGLRVGVLCAGLISFGAGAGDSGDFVVGKRGHVLVPVSIDGGTPRPFVLDTAASQTVLDPGEYPAQAGTSPSAGGTAIGHGAHGGVNARPTRVNSIALRELVQRDQLAIFMEVDQLTRGNEPDFAGVLGLPFLGQYRVDLDYPRRSLRFDAAGSDQPPCDICTPVAAIPVRPIIAGLPTVTVTINGRSMPALLDTGAASTILNEAAAAQLGLAGTVDEELTMDVELAIGGEPALRHAVRRIALPVFATQRLDSEPAILLGIDFRGRGRMVLDLASNAAWFKAATESAPAG
jgi:predicted aspartyl protease